MTPEPIKINRRYSLQLTNTPNSDGLDVQDWDGKILFANGTESECREWITRNCDEVVEHTEAPWKIRDRKNSSITTAVDADISKDYFRYAIDVPRPPFAFGGLGALVLSSDGDGEANAVLIATSPKLLAFVEEWHKVFPSPESGALIAEARGWQK